MPSTRKRSNPNTWHVTQISITFTPSRNTFRLYSTYATLAFLFFSWLLNSLSFRYFIRLSVIPLRDTEPNPCNAQQPWPISVSWVGPENWCPFIANCVIFLGYNTTPTPNRKWYSLINRLKGRMHTSMDAWPPTISRLVIVYPLRAYRPLRDGWASAISSIYSAPCVTYGILFYFSFAAFYFSFFFFCVHVGVCVK